MRQKSAAGLLEGFFVMQRARNEKTRFLSVAYDDARAAIRIEPRRFWFYKNRHLPVMAGAEHAICKSVSDQSFVVVGKNQAVEFLEH